MEKRSVFDRPAGMFGTYLATVVSVRDLDGRARVQVRLLSYDGATDQSGPIWARVAVPYAGAQSGAFLLPDVNDEVLVSFVNGDPRMPLVVGGLWNGQDKPPETLGGSGQRIDRWSLTGKAGTRIAIVEESESSATIKLSTPGGVSGTFTDEGGGRIRFEAAGTTVTLDSSGVSIQTGSKVQVQASEVEVSSGQVTVNAAISKFSGIVQCDTLLATTVVSSTYTPGAGNIW